MRLRCTALAAVACALAAAATSGAATRLQLTPAGNADFPDRSFVLTTPKPVSLDDEKVVIRENGRRVGELAVIPAGGAATRTFGTVLVIDATLTMRGRPIRDAVSAARAFARRRNPQQQLAIVTFNRETKVLLPFTTSQADIDEALDSTPPVACCTPLYDAVDEAVSLVSQAEHLGRFRHRALGRRQHREPRHTGTGGHTGAQGSVYGSSRSACARPRFALACSSSLPGTPEPTPRPPLLPISNGSSTSLAPSWRGSTFFATGLPRGLSENVVVEVKLAGVPGAARTTYRTPAIPVTPSAAVPSLGLRSVSRVASVRPRARDLRGPRGRPDAARHPSTTETPRCAAGSDSSSSLRRRRAHRVAATSPAQGGFVSRQFVSLDRTLGRLSWWERLKEDIEVGEYPIQPLPLVLGTIALTILTAFVLGTAFLPLYALFALAVPFIVRGSVKKRLNQRRQKFAEQLPDNLLVMAASLRAGHSFVGALNAVVEEADEPARSELRRAVADEQLGVPIESALVRVAERMKNGDLEQVALVASLQRETGGNTAAVLDTVVDTVRERFELRRLVKTLTAQGRLTRWILIGLPIAVGVIASLLNPYYMKPLFTTAAGQVMLAAVIAMMIVGSFMIKKILEIEL